MINHNRIISGSRFSRLQIHKALKILTRNIKASIKLINNYLWKSAYKVYQLIDYHLSQYFTKDLTIGDFICDSTLEISQ